MKPATASLLIDAGNTRVKFGWRRHDHPHREAGTLALGHAELDRLPEWLSTLPVVATSALGVSVADDTVQATLEQLLMQHAGLPMQWLRSSAQAAGVSNLYEQPEQLGNDRWIALVGMSARTPAPAILASFGTATTIDTLGPVVAMLENGPAQGENRQFEGGVILPGPELMRRSLATGTARLPYAEGGSVAFPRNTHTAISSGIAAAQAGAVIRQWRHSLRALGAPSLLFCTGGGWPLVAEEVTEALALAQSDTGAPRQSPVWLEAPVLDGLATLDQTHAS